VLRYAALILLALLIVLQIKLWTGAGGVRDVESLRETVAETRKANEALKARNDALQAEVRDLKEATRSKNARGPSSAWSSPARPSIRSSSRRHPARRRRRNRNER
jgi:cell division protein FtsB